MTIHYKTPNTSVKKSLLRCLLSAVFISIIQFTSFGQAFVNGSCNEPTGAALAPTSWAMVAGSTDMFTIPMPIFGWSFTETPTFSADGGTFTGAYSDIGMGYTERFEQTVTGFTIGETYTITYQEANFGICAGGFCPTKTAYWRVFVSGIPEMSSGNELPLDEGWQDGCVVFIATSTTHTIGFEIGEIAGPGINGAYGLIDNIQLIAGEIGVDDVTIDYPSLVMCPADGPQDPIITGGLGGSFSFSPAIGLVINADGQIDPVLSLDGTYDITYTVGCAGSDVVTIEIVSEELADFIYDLDLYCDGAGDPVPNFDADGDGFDEGSAGTFTAVPAGLVINSTTGVIDFDASDYGTYTVTNTIEDIGCGGDVETFEITLAPVAIADFVYDAPLYCVDGVDPAPNFDIDGDAVDDGTSGTFTSVPAGLALDAVTGVIDVDISDPGVYTVTNTVESEFCGDDVVTFEVTIVDVFYADFIYDAPLYCFDAADPSPIYDTDGDGTDDGMAGTFTAGVGLVIDATTGTIDLDASDPGTYTVTNTIASAECGDQVHTFELTVEPIPVMDATPAVSICNGADGTVEAFSSVGGAGTTYQWVNTTGVDVGFGISGVGDIPAFTGINASVDPIIVTVEVIPTTAAGCVGTPASFSVTVHPTPSVSFTKNAHDPCAPVTVKFNNTSVPGGSYCQWSFGDGETATGCTTVSHTYLAGGEFDVTLNVTSAEGCNAVYGIADFVTVRDVPIADFDVDPSSGTGLGDYREVSFINQSQFATSYEWDFGDGSPISTNVNETHIFPEGTGIYNVKLTAYDDLMICSDIKRLDVKIQEQILYFIPNTFTPDGDTYNETFSPVFTSGVDPYNFHLTIFNQWGEVIFETYNKEIGWDGTYGNGKLVQDGTYIWQLEFKELSSDKRHVDNGHITILK